MVAARFVRPCRPADECLIDCAAIAPMAESRGLAPRTGTGTHAFESAMSRVQPYRLAEGGALVDRSTRLRFRFNGKDCEGHPGDTLASALIANGVRLVGRSFKYHRPRGIVAAGAEEPNAIVQLDGDDDEPNVRATTLPLREGLSARSVNCWPGVGFDVGAVNDRLSRVLPAGFYYKTFMGSPAAGTSTGDGCAAWPDWATPPAAPGGPHTRSASTIATC